LFWEKQSAVTIVINSKAYSISYWCLFQESCGCKQRNKRVDKTVNTLKYLRGSIHNYWMLFDLILSIRVDLCETKENIKEFGSEHWPSLSLFVSHMWLLLLLYALCWIKENAWLPGVEVIRYRLEIGTITVFSVTSSDIGF
jgi:hypothetical protein